MYKVKTKVSNCDNACKGFQLQWGIKKLSIAIEHVNSYSKSKVMNCITACKICDTALMKHHLQSCIKGALKVAKCKKTCSMVIGECRVQ